jgi:hypothetical protein
MESKLQEDLNQIKTWSSQWRMKLSSEKTEYCIFSMGEITEPCGRPILVWNHTPV